MEEKKVSSLDFLIRRIGKLIDVKSLVTIALTIGFIVQCYRGLMDNDYSSVYLVVISFYFGTQYKNGEGGSNAD